MCGIVGAFNKATLVDRMIQLSPRGPRGWSIAVYSQTRRLEVLVGQGLSFVGGPIPDLEPGEMYIGHVVAPTGGPIEFHPARADNTWVWHNGMIDPGYYRSLNARETWDTKIIAESINRSGLDYLTEFQGSYALVIATPEHLLITRNAISPMYLDLVTGEFASIPFQGGELIPSGTVWNILPGPLGIYSHVPNDYNPYGI